jgi:hypothetical protein
MDANGAAEKWQRRTAGAVTDIQNGVQNTDKNPMDLAAKAQERMKARLLASIDSGKWAAGLRAVSPQQWKDAMINKGIPRISAGVQQAQPKMAAFFTELFPFQDSLVSKVESMPNTSLEDSINRMVTFTRGMAGFRRRGVAAGR